MKKLLLSLFLFISTVSFSQVRVGLSGGGNLTTRKLSADKKVADNSYLFACHGGILFSIPVTKQLSLQPGLNYQLKRANVKSLFLDVGYNDRAVFVHSSFLSEKSNFHYIELPLTLSYALDMGTFKISPFAGVYVACAMSAATGRTIKHIKGIQITSYGTSQAEAEEENTETKSLDFKTDVERWDLGGQLGLGFEFKKIFFRLQYAFGFSDIDRVVDQTTKNRGFGLSAGYWIR